MNLNEIQDINSEAGIIATLCNNPDFIWHSNELKPNHFFDEINGCIYYALSELIMQKNIKVMDVYNIHGILSNSHFSEKIIEKITIKSLNEILELGYLVSRNTVEEYLVLVDNVIGKALKRDIFKKLKDFEKMCFDDENLDIQSNIYNGIDGIVSKYSCIDKIPEMKDIVDEMWNEIISRNENNSGLISKIPLVNNFFTYEPEELILVCGKRKEGKSIWGLNELVYQLKCGKSVVYIDTEMSTRQQFERLLAHLTGIRVVDIKHHTYDPALQSKIDDAKNWLKTVSYTHKYMPTPDLNKVYAIIRRLKQSNKADFFIYDYIKSQNVTSSSEVYNIMGDACNFIKNRICGELKIPGLALAQLNRAGDIADSYKLEQFASVVALITRKTQQEIINDGEECGNYKFFVKCNRLGEQMNDLDTEYIDLIFNGNTVNFDQAKKQHEIDNPYC